MLLTLAIRAGIGPERTGAEAAGLRSIVGLGRMLAHEIKNPLAGIRGAAQLLKSGAKAEDAPLAQLIMDETDRRIVRLYITDRGRAVITYYVTQAAPRWRKAFDFVNEEDEAVVRRFFIQMIGHLSQLVREERRQ